MVRQQVAFITALLVFLCGDGLGFSNTDATIHIIGDRGPERVMSRPGTSVVFRPQDDTQMSSKAVMSKDPSLSLPANGRMNASDFAVPRVRGQDTKLTEIYVDDVLLQDPYSGLPLVDSLDLRAFGQMAYHIGATPIDVPSTNPFGALVFSLFRKPLSNSKVGLVGGPIYGSSIWGLLKTNTESSAFTGSLYGRQYKTSGRYPYYDDGGTPYNTGDNRTKTRENNDQSSYQWLPELTLQDADRRSRVKLLGLFSGSNGGITGPGSAIKSSAREHRADQLSLIQFSKALDESLDTGRWQLDLAFSSRENLRKLNDPQRILSGNQDSSELRIESRSVQTKLHHRIEQATFHVSAERAESAAEVSADSDSRRDLDRLMNTAYIGAEIRPHEGWTFEVKSSWKSTESISSSDPQVVNSQANPPPARSGDPDTESTIRSLTRGHSFSVAFDPGHWRIYGQLARHQRMPSLLEELGDGATIKGNPDLQVEKALHREFGFTMATTQAGTTRLQLALFQDDIDDKIAFVPILAQSQRAMNLLETKVQGQEVRVDSTFANSKPFLGFTHLTPKNLSNDSDRWLPGVARSYATVGIEVPWQQFTFRENSRYQGNLFRDAANSIEIPAYWLHDLFVDSNWKAEGVPLTIGLSILNFTDVKSLKTRAPGTSQNVGETALSDVDGYPLPGRQWRLSATGHF